MTPSHLATCTLNKRLTPHVWQVQLALPEGESMKFAAGQFVLFDVPDVDNPEDIQPRAYSIASPPSQDTELTFVFEYKDGGRASRWVRDMLQVGDTVRIQGPMGNFTLNTEDNKQYVFVGTGTGVAPLHSQLSWALESEGDTRPMHLFFGARREEDLFWVERFRALEKSYPNFAAHITLSKPHDEWTGLSGRVTDIIPQFITNYTQISSYVCGSPDMVRDVKDWLFSQGVAKSDVHFEGYV